MYCCQEKIDVRQHWDLTKGLINLAKICGTYKNEHIELAIPLSFFLHSCLFRLATYAAL